MAERKSNTPKALTYIPKIFSLLEKFNQRLAVNLALKLFLRPFRFPVPYREKEAVETAKIFNILVGKYNVAVYEWGEGPVIWVLHGWSGRATQLSAIIKELVKSGYKVYGIDAPGHGKSSGKKSNVLLFENALEELNKLKGPPFAFIGHSLGGAVGFFAVRNGIKIKKIVSIGTPSMADKIMQEYLLKIGLKKTSYQQMEKVFEKIYKQPFANFTAQQWVQPPPEVPVLIIHDNDDRDAPIHHAEALIELLPDAEVFITNELGHNRILRDNEVIKKVISFITEKPKHE
jgi:pimeloyl-ACP methyl ester carboxylesterase